MPFTIKDPLLAGARVLITVCIGALGVGIGALAIALPAMIFNQTRIAAELARNGTRIVAPDFFLSVCALISVVAVLLALAIWFLVVLRRIVATVAAGDPFIVENADRLSRMGWMALAGQVLSIPLGLVLVWLSGLIEQSGHARLDDDFGFSLGGVVLVLVLFILARVFRQGALMRDELEGTI
ncbi:DUF2975 domain-containing protein [Parablastomonas sp. CN1-191]|uniref:DUF2975 domain-containing protein n=1 Tax=Parablastomonas sp. CN1-191 TaxID=3400908 RepID=UPI003BF7CED0